MKQHNNLSPKQKVKDPTLRNLVMGFSVLILCVGITEIQKPQKVTAIASYVFGNSNTAGAIGADPVLHLSLAESFCAEAKKVESITASFQMIQWPTVGVPGVALGQQNTIKDFCNYLKQASR